MNRNWNNNWRHGNWGGWGWGGAGWGPGWGAGWGLGFGMGWRAGFWGGFAARPWFGPAALWGLGAWTLGSIVYDCGYMSYENPYYVPAAAGTQVVYDYSQPIQVVSQGAPAVDADGAPVAPAETPPPPEVQTALSHSDKAREAFRAEKYDEAGKEIDLALKQLPTDAALHEFRALVQFATGDYAQAAGTLYAVLSAGPGWDWTTMSSLYADVEVYTKQLRALEQYTKAHPEAADARFVLAYQYITASHEEAALRQLQEVVRLQPKDQLSIKLIRAMGGEVPGATPAPAPDDPQLADEEVPEPPDIDPTKIVGRRTASRPDGTKFTLNLTADNKFTWAFERGGRKSEFGGTYSVDGPVLVLERDDKSQMPGLVTMEGADFNFQLFGAPPGDQGLDFKS